jgi:hypothetical protein
MKCTVNRLLRSLTSSVRTLIPIEIAKLDQIEADVIGNTVYRGEIVAIVLTLLVCVDIAASIARSGHI